jgi:hypothetical protein
MSSNIMAVYNNSLSDAASEPLSRTPSPCHALRSHRRQRAIGRKVDDLVAFCPAAIDMIKSKGEKVEDANWPLQEEERVNEKPSVEVASSWIEARKNVLSPWSPITLCPTLAPPRAT